MKHFLDLNHTVFEEAFNWEAKSQNPNNFVENYKIITIRQFAVLPLTPPNQLQLIRLQGLGNTFSTNTKG